VIVTRVNLGTSRDDASSLPRAASYAIIDVCLQQRGSNRCRLVLVWGVERIFGDAGISGLA
jgi:hypothetical protein